MGVKVKNGYVLSLLFSILLVKSVFLMDVYSTQIGHT